MQQTADISASTLGRRVAVRFSRATFDMLSQHLLQDGRTEQFSFALFGTARTAEGTVLIVRDLLLPSTDDLQEQSAGGVAPTRVYQSTVYLMAHQRGLGILDIHTHTHAGVPRFSSVDEAESAKNAEYICKKLSSPATHAMIVFDQRVAAHDAVIYDRSVDAYRRIDAIEVVGRGIEIRPAGRSRTSGCSNEARYSRQVMIPGWDQVGLGHQRVAVIGVGGNGAQLVQTLVSIGVGTEGWIAAVDPDVVEESNLPRIPYVLPEDVGSPKVTVAARYAGRKNPSVHFYPYPCSVTEKTVIDRLKAATVIIGAGDNDGLRRVCNELAVRYQIPYIDLGCDIQVEDREVAAGGQVRVVLPGVNACLVCCNGYDPGTAALELMDEAEATSRAARGYVRGEDAQATPSVANLNATTAQLGITAFLALVHGDQFGSWDYAHFNQLTAETLVATTKPSESCPLCGSEGILADGDEPEERHCAKEPKWTAVEEAK